MDDLPVREIQVTRPAGSTDKLQASEIATNANIRTGGLVKIGGSYRTITKKTEDIVTFNPADETGDTTAYFVYGLVVDSQNERALNNGKIDEKDNDGIRENYSGNQDNGYDWNVTFNSAAIPDGPIQIHIVAFDNAGNIGHGYMETRASNNAPRITSVMLGTDLNGNERFDFGSGEFSTFYAQRDSNQNPLTTTGKEIWDLYTNEHMSGNKYWKVKNGLAVIPEFVGGRSDFYYQFSTHDTEGLEEAKKLPYTKDDEESEIADVLNTWKLKKAGTNTSIVLTGTSNAATWNYSGENDGGSLTRTSNEIKAAKAATGATTDDGVKWYRFSFWDSTEDSDPGLNTGSTVLNIKLEQDLVDGTSPEAYIEPFKWEGTGYTKSVSTTVGSGNPTVTASVLDALTANDVLGTSTEATTTAGVTTVVKTTITPKNSLYGASKANGHIELQEHIKNITAITSTLGVDDPKVSGKITFNGTVFDETRLSSIWFKFTDLSVTGFTQTTTNNETKYDLPAAGMKDTNGNTDYIQAAWYNKSSAEWELASTDIANNWLISVTDQSFDQDGHTAVWYLSIDTSKIDGVAGKDKALTIVALDAAGQMSTIYTSGEEDQTIVKDDGTLHKTSYYKVDVVPYITSIKTQLSGSEKIPSAQNRSAQGWYAVRRGEAIEISGFNLNADDTTNKTKVQINGTDVTPSKFTDTNTVYVNVTNTSLTNGNIDVLVNVGSNTYLTSLNNKNAKPVFDENMNCTDIGYNAEQNDRNNDLLTDDRQIYIMDVTSTVQAKQARKVDMFVHKNTINFASGYDSDSFAYFADITTNLTPTKQRNSFTRYFESKMAMNTSGTIFTVSTCGDAYHGVTDWQSGPSHFALTMGDTGNQNEYETPGENIVFLENNWNGASYNNAERQVNPDIVVSGNDALTKGYISYYDTTQKLIKFRYFERAENVTNITSGYTTNDTQKTNLIMKKSGNDVSINGPINSTIEQAILTYKTGGTNSKTYNQGFIAIAGGEDSSSYSAVAVTGNGTAIVSWFDAKNKRLKMKYNTSPATSFSGYQKFSTIPSSNGTYTYNLKVDSDVGNNEATGTTVTVEYKKVGNNNYNNRNKHQFAYQLGLALVEAGCGAYCEIDPTDGNVVVRSMQTGTGSKISITPSTTSAGSVGNPVAGCGEAWVEKTIDSNEAGKFVAMTVDTKNGIHMAYHATGSADLKYAYLSSITDNPVVVTVDGYQQVGQYIDIATATKNIKNAAGTNVSCIVPFISYYNLSYADSTSAVKCAYLNKPLIPVSGTATITSANAAGCVDEKFTGNWEVTNIPCATVPVQYRVNVGVKTNGDVIVSYLGDTVEYVKVW